MEEGVEEGVEQAGRKRRRQAAEGASGGHSEEVEWPKFMLLRTRSGTGGKMVLVGGAGDTTTLLK